MAQKLSVFLSYSSKDKSIARDLHHLLSDAGIDVWFDEVVMVPGKRWDSELRNAIAKAKVVLMLVGKSSFEEWQTLELQSALDRALFDDQFRIIPVLLNNR